MGNNDKDEELNRFQLIFNLISDEYNDEKTRKSNMDERASKIILFVGILVGLLASFGSLLLKDISRNSPFYTSYTTAFNLSLIFLVISIILAAYAYRIQIWTAVPNPSTVMKYGINKKPRLNILQIVSNGRCEAINENIGKIERNAKIIKLSYLFFLLGLITLLIFIISLFYTNPTFVKNSLSL